MYDYVSINVTTEYFLAPQRDKTKVEKCPFLPYQFLSKKNHLFMVCLGDF